LGLGLMAILKKILMIVLVAFLAASTLGIVIAVYDNTSIFKNEILLSCEINSSNKEVDFVTLVIDRKNEKVLWRGLKEGDTKNRDVKHFTDTEIKMSWKNNEGFDIDFILNRLDGGFYIEILKPKDDVDRKSKDESYFSTHTGQCYERQQKY
jgi:hypothetical protein